MARTTSWGVATSVLLNAWEGWWAWGGALDLGEAESIGFPAAWHEEEERD